MKILAATLGLFLLLGIGTRKYTVPVKLLLLSFLAVVIIYIYLTHG